MSSAVQSLEVSYFIQMTEDEEKVRRAVGALVGGDPPEERQEAGGTTETRSCGSGCT